MSNPDNQKKIYFPPWFFVSGITDSEEKLSTRIVECLDRYWQIMKLGKEEIKKIFNEREFMAIVSAMISHAWSDRAELLKNEILLNLRSSIPDEINLDTEKEKKIIVDKLKILPYHHQVALAEWIRDYWIVNDKNK